MRISWRRVGVVIGCGTLLGSCGSGSSAPSTTSGVGEQPGGAGGADGGGSSDAAAEAAPCTSCPSGLCRGAGECVECSRDEHCGNSEAHCDLERGQCVVKGCKDGAGCASGVCLPTHDCAHCLDDAECSGQKLCGSGVCSDPCGACASGLVCCEPRCVDMQRDIGNCGACGTACASKDFCAPAGCLPALISNLCALGAASALLDGAPADDRAAADVLRALEARCAPAPATRALEQGGADVINPANGRVVVSGGELLVLAGGPYFNKTAGFLEKERSSPVYNGGAYPTIQFIRSADDAVVASSTFPESTASHDTIVIQVAREPTTGTLGLMLYGFHPNGTLAAAWHFVHVMAADLASYPAAYYVYDWTDTNADQVPNAGDTWRLLGSGT
jgi:hypothetical protein